MDLEVVVIWLVSYWTQDLGLSLYWFYDDSLLKVILKYEQIAVIIVVLVIKFIWQKLSWDFQ